MAEAALTGRSENEAAARSVLLCVLHWNCDQVAAFVPQLNSDELSGLVHHGLHARGHASVGVAGVVYRARMRLASGDKRQMAAAAAEAERHFLLIKSTVDENPTRPKSPEPTAYAPPVLKYPGRGRRGRQREDTGGE